MLCYKPSSSDVYSPKLYFQLKITSETKVKKDKEMVSGRESVANVFIAYTKTSERQRQSQALFGDTKW